VKSIMIKGLNRSLEADVYEAGDRWVLLCHGKVFDKRDWGSLPQALCRQNLSVLALNFSGYGASSGTKDPNQYSLDIDAALDWLNERHPSSVSAVAASMGAVALIHWAQSTTRMLTLDTTVLFAPRAAPHAVIPTQALHCLFNALEDDADAHIRHVEEHLPVSQVHLIPGNAHAQNNFNEPQADEVVGLITSLVADA
jgi:alpha/beta superfamily hydrolase